MTAAGLFLLVLISPLLVHSYSKPSPIYCELRSVPRVGDTRVNRKGKFPGLWTLSCALCFSVSGTTVLVCLSDLLSSPRSAEPVSSPLPFFVLTFSSSNLSTAVLIPFFLPQNISLCNFLNCIILPFLLDIIHLFQSKGWCSPTPLLSHVGNVLCIYSSIGGISPRKRSKGHSPEITGMVSAQSRPLGLKVTCSQFFGSSSWKHLL